MFKFGITNRFFFFRIENKCEQNNYTQVYGSRTKVYHIKSFSFRLFILRVTGFVSQIFLSSIRGRCSFKYVNRK